MAKNFVIDTNVLIHDVDSIYSFADNNVIIPVAVIEELDSLKKSSDERGRNARVVTRRLDALRTRGRLNEGVKLDDGGMLRIDLDKDPVKHFQFRLDHADNRILSTAVSLQNRNETVILVTKDINLRIKAEVIGLTSRDYEKSKVNVEELYSGHRAIDVKDSVISKFSSAGSVSSKSWPDLSPNELVVLKSGTKEVTGKCHGVKKIIEKLKYKDSSPWGIEPLNSEQEFALELLFSDEINLVTLVGIAGSGKTLLSIACGLQKTVEEEFYRRLVVCRPIIPMGQDIGYLPGTKEEKLHSWTGAIFDNLEFLFENKDKKGNTSKKIDYLFDSGKIYIEALAYFRGRTLPGQYLIIDDAQNLTPHEAKTVISRAGKGTKVVFTGDPYQIDNPYLDAESNGLTYIVERFRGQDIYGHITFTKSERSKLAALAAELL